MAITATLLTSGTNTSTTITTASISPTTTPVMACIIHAMSAGGSPHPNATISGAGLTWTKVGNQTYSSRRGIIVYEGNGTPSSGTLSITCTGGAGTIVAHAWAIVELDGVADVTLASVNSTSGSGTSATVTISGTPGSTDGSFAITGFEAATNTTWEAGWTELADVAETTNVRQLSVAWDDGHDSTPSASWGSSDGWGIVGFYLEAEAGGPAAAAYMTTNTGYWGP